MNNIIDIKKVPVTELKTGNTYIGISQEGEVVRTTIEIPEGGGGTSTTTDSGVYVLEYVGVLRKQMVAGEWNSYQDFPYEGSERQTHNAEVYKAWKEGKVKALYYKHLDNNAVEYGLEPSYQLVPCTAQMVEYYENYNQLVKCMKVTALYKKNEWVDINDIYATTILFNENGEINNDYYQESHQMVQPSEISIVYITKGSEMGLGGELVMDVINSNKVLVIAISDENTQITNNYIANTFYKSDGSEYGCYVMFENGSGNKWTFTQDGASWSFIENASSDLSIYAEKAWVSANFVSSTTLKDYATKQYVNDAVSGTSGGGSGSSNTVTYSGNVLTPSRVWGNYENGKIQYIQYSGEHNGRIIEGTFPLHIYPTDDMETFRAFGWVNEDTIIKWDMMMYDDLGVSGEIVGGGSDVLRVDGGERNILTKADWQTAWDYQQIILFRYTDSDTSEVYEIPLSLSLDGNSCRVRGMIGIDKVIDTYISYAQAVLNFQDKTPKENIKFIYGSTSTPMSVDDVTDASSNQKLLTLNYTDENTFETYNIPMTIRTTMEGGYVVWGWLNKTTTITYTFADFGATEALPVIE